MFNFLKEKIKSTVEKFSKKVEEIAKEETKTLAEVEVKEEKKELVTKVKEKIKKEPEKKEVKTLAEVEKEEKKKEGFVTRIVEKVTTKKLDDEQFDKLFFDFEIAMLENNVAVEVIEKIKQDLRMDLVNIPIKRGEVLNTIQQGLKESIKELFDVKSLDLIEMIKNKKEKPFVICFVGVNGGGKTTTIAKVIQLLKSNGISCVVAAADTFRSAAIEQLEEHTNKLGVKLIKHDYKSDPAAVCFDAIEHAKAKNKDVVLIDTAGRLHSNLDLMNEMKKIVKVAKPDLKIFVGESIAGNDVVLQSKHFDEAVTINGIILTKSDVDERGGAIISVSYVTKKPILYLGVGQDYEDLQKFDPKMILTNLGF